MEEVQSSSPVQQIQVSFMNERAPNVQLEKVALHFSNMLKKKTDTDL